MTRVFISRDSTALSLGADLVTNTLMKLAADKGIDLEIVRNGSRGLFWLETLIEVETKQGRIAYGPVQIEDIAELLESGMLEGAAHRLFLGNIEELPFFKMQNRLTFARVGLTNPVSLDDYLANDGYRGLKNALNMEGAEIVKQVSDSGLRGRGGAAFPTGIKWNTVLNTASDQKYIVCNADEGDSGTFSDRMIMEGDPFVLIEGMTIAGLAVGATQGYIYLRVEYPHAYQALNEAIATAYKHNYLGANLLGSSKVFNLEVRLGAGAYICGEETSLLESLEGKRGLVRFKPPLPAIVGLFGKPTVVNNVISLASVPIILDKGGEYYRDYGMGRSRGTLPIQLAGNIKHAGLFEAAFGMTLRELLYDFGGGSASGRPIKTVQVGGPLGAYLHPDQFDTPLDYEAFSAISAVLGHGGIVVHDDSSNIAEMARYAMEFCVIESCGKCTPCRIGSTRGVEVIDRIVENTEKYKNADLLRDLCNTMTCGSLCAMGSMTPIPVLSLLNHYPEDFGLETAKA
jgi:formate dehydrogenase iron-sulfur subunit